MPNIDFDNTKVSVHALSDNNFQTESAAGVVRKLLFGDKFGNAIDPEWIQLENTLFFEVAGGVHTRNEAVGSMNIIESSADANQHGTGIISTNFVSGAFDIRMLANGYVQITQGGWFALMLSEDGDISDSFAAIFHGLLGGPAPAAISSVIFDEGAVKTSNPLVLAFSFPMYVRITKTGNVFNFYRSTDGLAWIPIHNFTYAGFSGDFRIGAYVNRNFQAGTNQFDCDRIWQETGNMYWANDPVVLFTAQDTGTPGAIIQMGSATGIFDATTLINIKFGTGAWSGDLTLAQLQLLGNQITDTGLVQIRTVHKNTKNQSEFTNLILPYITAIVPAILKQSSRLGLGQGLKHGNWLGVG